MCGAPDQDTLPALDVSEREAVVHGFVSRSGSPSSIGTPTSVPYSSQEPS